MLKTAVIGTDSPIGLAVVRELGERGVPVYAIGNRPDSIGGKSRHADRFFLRPRGPLAQWLPEFVTTHEIGAVMAISEQTLAELCALRGTLPGCLVIAPEAEKFALVLDKSATLDAARSVGIDVPASWQPLAPQNENTFPTSLTYPVAVKWSDPVAMIDRLSAASLPLEKVEYADNPEALRSILRKYDRIATWPMVQEYARGYGFGQMLHMHRGEATLKFQHRRLREWPPTGGISTCCTSVPLTEHNEQMMLSERLLRSIGWEGPAMVEYRHDPATGRYVLMEINGRLWGSIPLAYHCDANFAWETWRCAVGQAKLTVSRSPSRPRHRIARYMVPDTKHLLAQMKNALPMAEKLVLLSSFIFQFIDPAACYYVWSVRDPRPFLSDIRSIISQAARRGKPAPDGSPRIPPAASTLP
ncbi:MAG: carboxylate--amine ligase [Allopontixanthobacter sediminis]